MITPSHLIYSWALAKTTEKPVVGLSPSRRTFWFVFGALLPDTAVFVFFIINGLILGYSHEVLWDDMYFYSNWSVLFTLSHSLLLWPVLFALGNLLRQSWLRWLSISALLHISVDFCVHTADAYKHFWPLTDWRFISPVSYWNRAEYGQYVGLFDSILVICLLLALAYQYRSKRYYQLSIAILALLYIAKGIFGVL